MNQPVRGRRHLIDRVIECLLIGARGAIHAAQFSDELQRRSADFVISGWRLEIGEGLDVSAHILRAFGFGLWAVGGPWVFSPWSSVFGL
jgi:hypothetical protein